MINILVNERTRSVPANMTVGRLRNQDKPGADAIVVNGYPCSEDYILKEGDQVVLFRKGEIPQGDELEALMAARHTPGVHERMKKATIGIAGLGGIRVCCFHRTGQNGDVQGISGTTITK